MQSEALNTEHIKVMSWNVLSDVLSKPMYFPYAKEESLNYVSRIKRIVSFNIS
jgi:mRNA deadenylase 3'-5' endonuclease subunit Ccr4